MVVRSYERMPAEKAKHPGHVHACMWRGSVLPADAHARPQVAELRKRTDQLPDDYWVVLVGDMITEEALPTYMAMLNTLDGVRDETGASATPGGRCAPVLR